MTRISGCSEFMVCRGRGLLGHGCGPGCTQKGQMDWAVYRSRLRPRRHVHTHLPCDGHSVSLGSDVVLVWGQFTFPFEKRINVWWHLKFNIVLCLYQVLESMFSCRVLSFLGELPLTKSQPGPRVSFFAGKGELFVWGKNIRGCLGIGRLEDQYFPWRVRLDWVGLGAFPQSRFTWCGRSAQCAAGPAPGPWELPPLRVLAALLLPRCLR